MEYTFIWKIEKYLKNDRKNALYALNTDERNILKHIYLNKRMPEIAEFMHYVKTSKLEFEPVATLQEILEYASSKNRDKEVLFEMISSYLLEVLDVYGKSEARKASAVIFGKKKISGIRARDVKSLF